MMHSIIHIPLVKTQGKVIFQRTHFFPSSFLTTLLESRKTLVVLFLLFVSFGMVVRVLGQVSIPNTSPVIQNFDVILGNSAAATLPTGFVVSQGTIHSGGTSVTTLVAGTSGTGALTGSSTGGTYNFANGVTASSTDRALGFLTTGSFTSPRSIMVQLTNNTGSTISSLAISFDYEKYRAGTRIFDMNFFHGSDGSTWTANASGDQNYAADGANAVVNPPTTISKSFNISSLSISNGASYYLRWTLTGSGGSTNGQGIAIDNVSLTASFTTSCTPPTVSATGLNTVISTTSINLTWTNPVSGADGVIVLAKSVTGVSQTPVSGIGYTANSVLGLGSSLGSGNFVVYTGTGNNVSVTGLTASTAYYFSVYTYSNTGICYNTTNVLTGTGITDSGGGSSITDYFRSRQTGDWSAIATWESSPDNVTWINATLVPSSTANNIFILSGHNVSITDSRFFDQTTISGTLTLNAGTNVITIADGIGSDLVINNGGVMEVAGTNITTTVFTGTIAVNNTGIIRYTSGAGSSISLYLGGTSSSSPNNPKIVYGNGSIFEWNSTSSYNTSGITYFETSTFTDVPIFRQTQAIPSVGASNPTQFNGIYEANATILFQNSGTKTFRNGIIGTGNVTQASGCGQFIISGTNATIGGTGNIVLTVSGMVGNSGSSIVLSSNKIINKNVADAVFTVNGSIDCSTFILSGTSTFSLANNATLITANSNGVTGSNSTSGSIQMSSSNELFDDGASYIFNGSSVQSTGFSGTSTQINGVRNISISNTSGIVTLDSDIQSPGIIGVLSVPSNTVFSTPDGKNINKSGSGIISVAGILQIGDNNGFANASSANFQGFSASDFNFSPAAIVEYNGGGQVVSTLTGYPNLLISTSGDKTPEDNFAINGNLSITGSGVLVAQTRTITLSGNWLQASTSSFTSSAATVVLNGGSANINTQGESFENLVIASSSTKTLLSNLSVTQNVSISGGTFDVGTNTFNGGANLYMTNGSLRLAKTAVTLPELSGTYFNTGGIIELYGNGNQSLRGTRDYSNLYFSANSITTLTSLITSVAGVSISGFATLNTESNTFGSSATTLTMTGASKLIVAGGTTKPDMDGAFSLASGTTIEFSGTSSHIIRSLALNQNGGNYQNIIISGTDGNRSLNSSSSILKIAGNFTNNYNGTTALGFNANNGTISFTGTSQIIGGSAVTDFYNLNLGNGSNVSLASSQRIINTLTLGSNATFNTANQAFILVSSTATGTARIAAIPASSTILGTVIQQRFVPTAKRIYRYLASPFQNATFNQWQGGTQITGAGGAVNGFDPSGTNAASCFYYVESVPGADFYGFTSITATSQNIEKGRGYRLLIRGDRSINLYAYAATQTATGTTLTLSGFPNIGDQVLPVTYANTVATNDGWNLVGNPYSSEINWNAAGWTKTNIGGSIYVWDSSKGASGGYYTFNGSISDDGRDNGNIIPSMMGFFVRASAVNPDLRVTEAVKYVAPTTYTGNGMFRTEAPEGISNLVRLKFSNPFVLGYEDFAAFHFRAGAAIGFDADMDAYKYGGSSVSLSSQPEKGLFLSINSMPLAIDSVEIPLKIYSPLKGTHAFSVQTFENIDPAFSFYLKDKYPKDTLLPISENFNYPFELNTDTGSTSSKRFIFIAKKSKPSDPVVINPLPEDTSKAVIADPTTLPGTKTDSNTTVAHTSGWDELYWKLYPNPVKGNGLKAFVTSPKSMEIAFVLYDLLGKQLMTKHFNLNKGEQSLELTKDILLPQGIYQIKIMAENNSHVEKISIVE